MGFTDFRVYFRVSGLIRQSQRDKQRLANEEKEIFLNLEDFCQVVEALQFQVWVGERDSYLLKRVSPNAEWPMEVYFSLRLIRVTLDFSVYFRV